MKMFEVRMNFDHFLTAVPTVCTGDELFGLLVTVLFLGPQTETTDGYGLCHRLREKNRDREQIRPSY